MQKCNYFMLRDGTTQGLRGAMSAPPPQPLKKYIHTSMYINKKNLNSVS